MERRLEGGRGEENRGKLGWKKNPKFTADIVTMDLAKQIQGK